MFFAYTNSNQRFSQSISLFLAWERNFNLIIQQNKKNLILKTRCDITKVIKCLTEYYPISIIKMDWINEIVLILSNNT